MEESEFGLSRLEERQIRSVVQTLPLEKFEATAAFAQSITDLDQAVDDIFHGNTTLAPNVHEDALLMLLVALGESQPIAPLSESEGGVDRNRKRELLLQHIHQTAEMTANAKKAIEGLGDDIWVKSRAAVWDIFHQAVFGETEIVKIREKFPSHKIRAFRIAFLRFLERRDNIVKEKVNVVLNPKEFAEKCFKEKLNGRLFKEVPEVEITPLAVIFYLSSEDYNMVDKDSQGFTEAVSAYPQLSHQIIAINKRGMKYAEAIDDEDIKITRKHELQHAYYYLFCKENELGTFHSLDAQTGNYLAVPELHQLDARMLQNYFLEREKNELISYNIVPNGNKDAHGPIIYRNYIDIVVDRLRKADYLSETTRAELIAIWENSYQEYLAKVEKLRPEVDMFYGDAQRTLGISHEKIEAMVQNTPTDKVPTLIKIVMNLETDADLMTACREFKIKPVRDLEQIIAEQEAWERYVHEQLDGLPASNG